MRRKKTSQKILMSLSLLFIIAAIFIFGFTKVDSANVNQSEHSNNNQIQNRLVTIGILIPLEHTALDQIVTGFKETVSQSYPNAQFDLQNAQGDIKLQRSILERFVGKNEDLIIPIGTTATQMALSYVKQQPLISLAADYSEEERQKRKPLNITGVLDEIGGIKKIDLIKQIYPDIKKITLVFHNGNEKNYKEIAQIVEYSKGLGIHIQKLGINGLPELETVGNTINQDAQAVLILKDHLIASGIKLLIPSVEKLKIPLIASDEGSVTEGAAFALGVKEKMIGEEGGKLAIKVLNGEEITKLPMVQIQSLVIFYNKAAALRQKVDIPKLQEIAEKDKYELEPVE